MFWRNLILFFFIVATNKDIGFSEKWVLVYQNNYTVSHCRSYTESLKFSGCVQSCWITAPCSKWYDIYYTGDLQTWKNPSMTRNSYEYLWISVRRFFWFAHMVHTTLTNIHNLCCHHGFSTGRKFMPLVLSLCTALLRLRCWKRNTTFRNLFPVCLGCLCWLNRIYNVSCEIPSFRMFKSRTYIS